MITKLADKWRVTVDCRSEVMSNGGKREPLRDLLKCADELEAALPKWTRITDDPDTWPDDGGASVMVSDEMLKDSYCSSRVMSGFEAVNRYCTTYWRPLCDLDYPQEQL